MTTALVAPPRRFEAVSSRVLNERELRLMLGQFRKKRLASVVGDFKFRPGFIYNSVRAISARVNQNYDAWPSEELKKSYRTFLGKPCFVNHRNEDWTKARGRVVAARYLEKGADKYVDVIQEIDAIRFPKLAHEIITGGMDSVSMGVEAGFTICSICENRATDIFDMCSHVKFHKGEHMVNHRTGKKELVYEKCYKLGFFELSYVFDPADETAVVSRVIAAGKHQGAGTMDPQFSGAGKHQALDLDGGHKLMIFPPDSNVSPLPGENPRPAQWEWAHLKGKPTSSPNHFIDHEVINHGVSPREDRAKADAMSSYQAEQAADRLDSGNWDPDRDPHDPRYDPKLSRRRRSTTPDDSVVQLPNPGDHWGTGGGANHDTIGLPAQDPGAMRNIEQTTLFPQFEAPKMAANSPRRWLAYGETRAPKDIDTLRDEDESETGDGIKNPFHHWIDSPSELQDPDTSDAHRLDRNQEDQGLDEDRRVEDIEEFGAPSPVDEQDPEYTDPEHDDLAMPINPPAPQKGRRMSNRGVLMARRRYYAADVEDTGPEDGDYADDQGYDDGGDPGYADDGGDPQDSGDDFGGDDGSDPDALVTEAEQDLADYEHEQAAGDDGSYESDEGGYDDGGDEGGQDDAPPWADDGSMGGEDVGDDYGSEDVHDDGGDAPPWEDNREARRRRNRPVKKRGTRGKKRARRGGAPMPQGGLADRARVASANRGGTRHFADDNGYTDGGPYGVDDSQGAQEDVFISQVPSAEAVDMPADDEGNISNTPETLVARRRQANPMTGDFDPAHYQKLADSIAALAPEARRQMATHMAKTLVRDNPAFNWRTFFAAAKVPFSKQALRRVAEDLVDADKVDPPLPDTGASDLKGDEFDSLALDDVETQPKDASIHAFRQFDAWLAQATGRTARQHGNANYIRRAAVSYAQQFRNREAALAGLFPTLEYVLREARKIEATRNRRANMRRQAEDTSLDTAAPDGRVDVEAPVKNVTDELAQSSQFDLGDYAQNAGDDIADPVLDVVDGNAGTWAPDQGKEASIRLASSTEAMRCAMAYQKAMPRKYGGEENLFRLTARFETMRQAVVRDRMRLLEEVAGENRTAARRKQVTAGRSRGTTGIPMGMGAPARVASTSSQDFITDPSTDYALFI